MTYISEDFGVLIQNLVQEANGLLSLKQPFVVDPVDHSTEHRSSGASPSTDCGLAILHKRDVGSQYGDIRERTSRCVICSFGVVGVVGSEVAGYGLALVRRLWVDVAKAT